VSASLLLKATSEEIIEKSRTTVEIRTEVGSEFVDSLPHAGVSVHLRSDGTYVDQQSAAALAKEAFLKRTKNEVIDYSVRPGKHTATSWHFLFRGEKSFLRPGNHWDVAVNRKTGVTKIVDGL
jgi:hypothetical protein